MTAKRIEPKAEQARAPLGPSVIDALGTGATNPETMLMQNHVQTNWEIYIARVAGLAATRECGKLLMEGFDRGEGDSLARAAGFTQADINNERKHLKRLGQQAAEEMRIGVPADADTDEGEST